MKAMQTTDERLASLRHWEKDEMAAKIIALEDEIDALRPKAGTGEGVERYGTALNGWLESMEHAGSWDAPTLKRLRENIGPILDEMRSPSPKPRDVEAGGVEPVAWVSAEHVGYMTNPQASGAETTLWAVPMPDGSRVPLYDHATVSALQAQVASLRERLQQAHEMAASARDSRSTSGALECADIQAIIEATRPVSDARADTGVSHE